MDLLEVDDRTVEVNLAFFMYTRTRPDPALLNGNFEFTGEVTNCEQVIDVADPENFLRVYEWEYLEPSCEQCEEAEIGMIKLAVGDFATFPALKVKSHKRWPRHLKRLYVPEVNGGIVAPSTYRLQRKRLNRVLRPDQIHLMKLADDNGMCISLLETSVDRDLYGEDHVDRMVIEDVLRTSLGLVNEVITSHEGGAYDGGEWLGGRWYHRHFDVDREQKRILEKMDRRVARYAERRPTNVVTFPYGNRDH